MSSRDKDAMAGTSAMSSLKEEPATVYHNYDSDEGSA